MKKIFIFLLLTMFLKPNCYASDIQRIWEFYKPKSPTLAFINSEVKSRILGIYTAEKSKLFFHTWAYSPICYELYYYNSSDLAKAVYNLAIFTKDISSSISFEKFIKGVQGYRYSIEQVCAWLNSMQNPKKSLDTYELELVNLLLQDKIIILEQGKYRSSNKVKHILAASDGKKRTFSQNLKHERLHVLWEEDANFKKASYFRWLALSFKDKQVIKEGFKQYNDFEDTIIKEWIIRELDQDRLSLSDLNIKVAL